MLLGPPREMQRGTCGALPVVIGLEKGEIVGFASYWKPTPEELAALNGGAHVKLQIFGGGHPPVWVDVERVAELP